MCEVGDHDWRCWGREKRKLSVGSRCIFFDLFPQKEVLFVFQPLGVLFVHEQGVVRELFLWQKLFNEHRIGFLLLLGPCIPLAFFLGQEAKDYLPAVLPQKDCFIGNALSQKHSQALNIDNRLVKHLDQAL